MRSYPTWAAKAFGALSIGNISPPGDDQPAPGQIVTHGQAEEDSPLALREVLASGQPLRLQPIRHTLDSGQSFMRAHNGTPDIFLADVQMGDEA